MNEIKFKTKQHIEKPSSEYIHMTQTGRFFCNVWKMSVHPLCYKNSYYVSEYKEADKMSTNPLMKTDYGHLETHADI